MIRKFKVLIILALCAVLIQLIYGFALFYMIGTEIGRGTFGDMFGAISAFFTGVTLAGLIYTIHQQQKDLIAAQEATNRAIIAQEKSAEALKQQAETLHRTATLNAYSIMISSYNHLIQEMKGFDITNKYKQEREKYLEKLKKALNEMESVAK